MVQPSASAPPPSAPDPSAIGLETFGFDLNNREIASLIYIGLAVAGLLLWSRMRASLGGVVRAAFHPKLTLIYLAMSVYVALCTALLALVDAWEWSNLKTTLLWWITAGFGAVFNASQIEDPKSAISRQLRDVLTWTAVVMRGVGGQDWSASLGRLSSFRAITMRSPTSANLARRLTR